MSRHLKRRRKKRPSPRHSLPQPLLKFTPTAWAKLVWLRDRGATEIGGFGIASSDDRLLIDEIRLVKQQATLVTVAFDDESVADLFDELVDEGLQPDQFARVWIHTHPGTSARPSQTDEQTFSRCFGRTDWAVMFILAQAGESSARLRFHVGPGGEIEIPITVDWTVPFHGSDFDAWEAEYQQHVQAVDFNPYVPDPLMYDGLIDAEILELEQEYH